MVSMCKLCCEAAIIKSQQNLIVQHLLRDIRKEAGVSQLELSRRLHKPQSFVSKYESGERRLDILEVHFICHALGISLTAFVLQLEKLIQSEAHAT